MTEELGNRGKGMPNPWQILRKGRRWCRPKDSGGQMIWGTGGGALILERRGHICEIWSEGNGGKENSAEEERMCLGMEPCREVGKPITQLSMALTWDDQTAKM